MQEELSIYIHYPFCQSKCPYCDFNSHVHQKIDHERFILAYQKEIEFFAAQLGGGRKIKTIFFGGGTPSLMPINLVEKILQKINDSWLVDKNCEVTLETNPTSFESSKFKDLRHIGINRLSIGVQSLNDDDLKFLGRKHSSAEAISVIKEAQKIFDNFSFDLIYARPSQTLSNWLDELKRALDFGSNHISLYQLTIEKGTQFFRDFAHKKFTLPDENLSAQLYEKTNETLWKAGFEDYEISNYARKNFSCQHNLVYWQGGDYLGIGAGAHSRLGFWQNNMKMRRTIMMIHDPILWLKKVENEGAGIQNQHDIFGTEMLEELILTALRLKDGLNAKILQKIYGDKNIGDLFNLEKLQKLENQGLIALDDGIKIIQNYRILTNAIIAKIVDAIN